MFVQRVIYSQPQQQIRQTASTKDYVAIHKLFTLCIRDIHATPLI